MKKTKKRIGYSIGQKQFFDNDIGNIHDYEAYFITISATHKAQLFQNNVGATIGRPFNFACNLALIWILHKTHRIFHWAKTILR